MSAEVEAIIRKLQGVYLSRLEPPDVDQRIAAYWHGAPDEEAGYTLSLARTIATHPIAQELYLARVAGHAGGNRAIKEWAYAAAVEFANSRGTGQRARRNVEGYRPEWGHQAARDGVARALFPDLLDEMPGRDARCKELKVGHQAYERVRDHIMREALDLFSGFRLDLECMLDGKWTREMIHRWEAATGANWADRAR